MSIKEEFGATNGISMRTIEDQSQIVGSMGKLLLVDGQLYSMGNQRAITQGLVLSKLIRGCQVNHGVGVCVSTNDLI